MVPSYKRHTSYLEYQSNGMRLVCETLTRCLKMPKRTTRFLGLPLTLSCLYFYMLIIQIKKLYSKKDEYSIERRKHKIEESLEILDFISAVMETALNHDPRFLTDSQWEHWFETLDKEVALLEGLKKSCK